MQSSSYGLFGLIPDSTTNTESLSMFSLPATEINTEALHNGTSIKDDNVNGSFLSKELESKYSLALVDLYKLGLKFYREKDGKAFNLAYPDRLKLVAYSKQIAHGKYCPNQADDVGYFDIIGNDRRQAWETLGDMSKEEAMAGFVHLLENVCSPFKVYLEAQKRDAEERQRQINKSASFPQTSSEDDDIKRQRLEEEIRRRLEQHRQIQEAQRQQIQEALNRQTYHQFRAYAEQQHLGDLPKQDLLIKELQDQHYKQYMEQVYTQQYQALQVAAAQEQQAGGVVPTDATSTGESNEVMNATVTGTRNNADSAVEGEGNEEQSANSDVSDSEQSDTEREAVPSNPNIQPASLWTRKDIAEFKETIKKEGSEGVIKVGHGETVTVRVPTHEDGACLFWEFATDSYDIGFGVYFEWTISETNTVSVHISESSDEEDEVVEAKGGDVERSGGAEAEKQANKPAMDEIIPVYRRDCHEEVYAGSHVYPGRGVYLLKFDNSYSLWRSKTLYYRVYYSR